MLVIILAVGGILGYFYFKLSRKKDTSDSDLLINFSPENDSIKTNDIYNEDEEMITSNNIIEIGKNSGSIKVGLITEDEIGTNNRRRIKFIPKNRNVKINLPYLSEDLDDRLKKSFCGKCFMRNIEKRDTLKDIVGIKNEHISRIQLIAKASAGGELSREEIKRLGEFISSINEELIRQTDKNKSQYK